MGPSFQHLHHNIIPPPAESEDGHYDWYSEPSCTAAIRIRYDDPPTFTTIKLDLETDDGKRVCQQVMLDMGYFWLDEPIDYLAFYTRDW